MYRKTITNSRTKQIEASTGASTEPVDAPRLGWHQIKAPLAGASAEDRLIDYLTLRDYAVKKAGSRFQRYDLEIINDRWVPLIKFGDPVPVIFAGKYEVKSLYRAKPTHSFDRRFKVGSRGETIYGRRDAQIKALALDVENYLEHGLSSGVAWLDGMHGLVDDALARRHSKSFIEKFTIVAEAYDDLWNLSSASVFLDGGIQGTDIMSAFSDIDGIFITAGDYFTLVSKDELAKFLTFDSVSVEGVKLRYIGPIQ